MRAYFVILALLLPHLVLSQSHINKPFARRTRSSPKFAHSPRQLRFSRYIQEPELQEVQQKSTDDVDSEAELQQQLMVDNFGQEKSVTKPVSYTSQTPIFETSTSRPLQQEKDEVEDVLPQLNHPLSEFEDSELSQNYLPSQDASYSPVKQLKERGPQKTSQLATGGLGYSSGNGYSAGNGAGYSAGNGYSAGTGPGYSAGSGSELSGGDALGGFEEDINSVDTLKTSVRGEPGKDYPVYASVPSTSFKCGQQQFPGYYADIDAQCQVFHICQADGRANAFLCPNGTIFSQRHFVCVWWYEFDCSTAEQFYGLNAELYKETQAKQNGIVGGSVPLGGSVPVGGSVPLGGNGKLSSPKANLNKMYMAQIDEFNSATTPSSPSYYGSNGKTTLRGNGPFKATTQPLQYDVGSVESVTPSAIDSYDTTPYNLDEALGEEIHSETPLIESLSLTTNLPKLSILPKSYGAPSSKSNGNGLSSPADYYSGKTSAVPDYGFGSNKISTSSPKPSYGAVKGANKPASKTSPKISQVPEAPVKSARNGSVKSKMSYGNGNSLKAKSNGNGYKPTYSGYGGFKQ